MFSYGREDLRRRETEVARKKVVTDEVRTPEGRRAVELTWSDAWSFAHCKRRRG